MKAEEIINQLQSVLPQLTDLFTKTASVISITPSGLTATATTSSDHGFKVDEAVAISGSFAPVAITSITRSGTLVTVVTTTDHDITEIFHENVTLSGANESEFNGTFKLNTAKNRRTFTFLVADSGPTTGTGSMLLEDPPTPIGFNGLFPIVSVPSTKTFTYTLSQTLTENAVGTILAHSSIRLTGAVTIERAIEMYTKQNINELWAFVILDDSFASKDRMSRNDGITSIAPGGDRRQQVIQSASVFVFAKVTQELSGRATRDLMVDVRKFLLKSLVGVEFDSNLTAKEGSGLVYVGDGLEAYDGAVYVHRYEFQLLSSITNADTVEPGFNVAFRDINISMATNLGTEVLTADIDLDDEPLP